MITEANVTVIVSDIRRSISFYVDTLGLKLIAHYGNQYAQVSAPGVVIGLHPASKGGPLPGDSVSLSIGFGVDNLDVVTTKLRRKGVAFSKIVEDGPVRFAFFTDPDGNPLYLSQTRRWVRPGR